MSGPHPDFSNRDQVEQLLATLEIPFDDLRSFKSEMDHLWKVTEGESALVLRISNSPNQLLRIDFENNLLKHLEKKDLPLGIPRLRLSTTYEFDEKAYAVRLFDWLDGTLLAHYLPRDRKLLTDLGIQLGLLTSVLQDFEHSTAQEVHSWKIDNLPWVKANFGIYSADRHPIVREAFAEIEENLLPILPSLRESVCHHDANEHNLLVQHCSTGLRFGIIDFGDACSTKTSLEAAIACAYIMMISEGDPILDAMHFLRGYRQSFQLVPEEIDVLIYMIKARLLISLTHSTLRRTSQPDHAYNQVSHEAAWQLLRRLAGIDSQWVTCCFRHASDVPTLPKDSVAIGDSSKVFPLFGGNFDLSSLPIIDLSVASNHLGSMEDIADSGKLDLLWQDQLTDGWGVGKYLEPRAIYTAPEFSTRTYGGLERRSIHLGIDVFAPALTSIYAPLPCQVIHVENFAGPRDYGPTLILQLLDGSECYLLLGHLHADILKSTQKGKVFEIGDPLAKVGTIEENGGWTPHVHVQIYRRLFEKAPGSIGVASPTYLDIWKKISPCPAYLLGLSEFDSTWSDRSSGLSKRRQKMLPSNLSLSYQSPLHMVRGNGAYLIDNQGQRYLDMVNNVAHVGHENAHVVQAIQKQAATLNTNTRYLHRSILDFSDRLLANVPTGLDTVYLCNSGSEANDLAMRITHSITGRSNLLAIEGAYHGHTQACIDVSSYKFAGKGGQGKPEHVALLPLPDSYRGRYQELQDVALFEKDVIDSLASLDEPPAAFIHESIMSCAGQLVLPDQYLSTVYNLVRKEGVITIADEVQTGCGRPGSCFWAFEVQGVVPDIITIGKPIGNGHPLAAVVTTREIADRFANGMEYFNTFAGNPVSCEVGSAVLQIISDQNLMTTALHRGNKLMNGLRRIQNEVTPKVIGDIRGHGLFIGIEFIIPDTKIPNPKAASYIVEQMLMHRILLSTDGLDNNVIKIKPPMVISDSDIDYFLGRFRHVMQHAWLKRLARAENH